MSGKTPRKSGRSRARSTPKTVQKSPRAPTYAAAAELDLEPRSEPSRGSVGARAAARFEQALAARAFGRSSAGRPSSYSTTMHARICAFVEVGLPIALACEREHISRQTLYNWRQRGAAGEEPFATFERDLRHAIALAESEVLQLIIASTEDDWKAGAWWLERRFPKRYLAKQTVRIEKPARELTDAELDAELARLGYVRPADPISTLTDDSAPPSTDT